MNNPNKDRLKIIANDQGIINALEILFNEEIEVVKPSVDKTDDDEVLGQKFRAWQKSTEIFKNILLKIEEFKEYKENTNAFDKAK
jgi:hypothetical protein